MFLGNRAALLKLMICISIAISSLLLYAMSKNVLSIIAGEAAIIGILLRTGKLAVIASRASFSLMSVATFLVSQNITGSVLFLISAVLLFHSPLFLILNPPPSKVAARRAMGSAFLVVFLVVEQSAAIALAFLSCCAFLMLQDYLALRRSVKQASASGSNTSKTS